MITARDLTDLSIEIFSAPKPFVGEDKANNERAIKSWLRLNPKPKVTLLDMKLGMTRPRKSLV